MSAVTPEHLREPSLADRRHQRDRKRSWAKRILDIWDRWPVLIKRSDDDGFVSGLATTPKPCSCWMCMNRRRLEGASIQELRQPQLYEEDQ
jgi:hypothetical protein